jgi:hypothetical protein
MERYHGGTMQGGSRLRSSVPLVRHLPRIKIEAGDGDGEVLWRNYTGRPRFKVVGACLGQKPAVEGRKRRGDGEVPWRNYARSVKAKCRRCLFWSNTSCRRKPEAERWRGAVEDMQGGRG